MSALRVEFEGDVAEVAEGHEFSFGREADLILDTNPYLHRKLGVFRSREGAWWLMNVGSAIGIDLCDGSSPSRLTISPGNSVPIPFAHSLVRFQAGPTTYELTVVAPRPAGFEDTLRSESGSTTITATQVPLNDEQQLLLVALSELRLMNRGAPPSELPTNRQAADRLGWTITKFNRKLDHLCAKFDRLGVAGLKGDVALLASNRRERLVDHALTVGLIGIDDLAQLGGSQ